MNCLSGYSIDGIIYPSVSRILSSNPKNETARKSAALNSAALSQAEARQRGLAIHKALQSFLKTGEADLNERYLPYWQQLQQALQLLDLKPLWADGPISPELSHLQNGDHSCVWSKKLKVQGCPDLFGEVGGVKVIGELKTGTILFNKHYQYGNFRNYWNYFKHHTALLQAGAYACCTEETIGFKPEAAIIINITPDANQIFISEGPELLKAKTAFRKLAKDFFKSDGINYTMQEGF